jgi:23S rRNA pseudouridine2605 synthase
MCEAVGHPVLELRRVAFGPLHLDGLAAGACRRLSEVEVEQLRKL